MIVPVLDEKPTDDASQDPAHDVDDVPADASPGPAAEGADETVDVAEDGVDDDAPVAPAPGDAVDPVAHPAADPVAHPAADPAAQPEDDPLPRPTPRAVIQSVGMLAAAVLVGILAVVPAPYAVNGPGPTTDVLGEVGGSPLIEVDGATTYPSTGELRLTTISGVGGPGYPAYLVNVLRGWVSRASVVRPVEEVYPQDATREEIEESNAGLMVSSQENAAVAALVELGYEVPATLVVAGTVEGTDAVDKLEEGDVLTAMDGEPLADYQSLVARLAEIEPGTTISLTVRRHAQDVEVAVVTGEREDGGAQIGVFVDPSFDMPVDVSINIEGVGGPSAGTMFALGLVDLLTPEDEAAGEVIAGTGTIDVTGAVGPIGGIRQKLAGAVRDGAAWFLAPDGNCDEVVGHVPRGLRVVRVATLHDAREAMEAIGAGETDELPTCTAG
ncbi:PDZ/DHR/GLGF domain protein [Cellulomonas flavigena DSM 20109]|uniref:PDZ/DHR/GLGF domain protein n=1 Tax=Cellulomonas flavigena (strain ATCC 482 / DSM 20109 / BCRC 11376 / JCM 18109 / NBRC 3775 / NCIMB 8073 / NRS 134) TaxID=446466 RepID=D5UHN0_CELFN|nr:S16 family serine protease [Cellulomonas flavigena]ADG75351.1 PDZ/DHR/GLGF domain protein [Cellulomonas flavigena DSM 20109]